MVFNKIVFIISMLCSTVFYGQQVTLKGTVKDSLQNPLAYANIIATPHAENKNLSFAISDDNGKYQLQLTKNEAYVINISFMGYEKEIFSITPTNDTIKNFTLKEQKNVLEEVVVELPVTVKKDTIIYNAKHFLTGEERKLKNVLNKLPGVEVDKNGNVTVQGKRVTEMMVEGKRFFGGNSKLAVDNIPANAVDKVEVIDNYNEVSFLKNVSDSDEMAMNIHLKEDKKRFVFGDIEAGKGNQDFYRTHSNVFYYAPKNNFNFIGNINNIGEKTFTFEDYLSFSGGLNAVFSGNFNFQGGDFTPFLESQDLASGQQRFGALHLTKTTSDKLDISGYAIFSHANTQHFLESVNRYSAFIENKMAQNHIKNVLGIGRLSLEYTPNIDEKWYFRTQLKKNNNYKTNAVISQVNTTNIINTYNNNGSWYANQNVEWHKKQSKKHTFSATANYTYDKNNPATFWQTTLPILQGLITIDTTQKQFRWQQTKTNEKHGFHTIFKDFWLLHRNHHLYTTIGNSYQQESFVSNDHQILGDNSAFNLSSAGFNNGINFNHNDFYVGLHYKFRTGIFIFKQGAHWHKYDWKTHQQPKLTNQKWVLLPDFLMKIEFKSAEKIQLEYHLKSNFSEASKLANRFYLQSYNSVFRGNESLENELYHSAKIRYSRFSLYKKITLMLSASYTKKIDGLVNTVTFDGINQFLTLQSLQNPSENWGLNAGLRKQIKHIRYKLSGSYNNSAYTQIIDNQIFNNKNKNFSFDVGFQTLFKDLPVAEVGFKKRIGNFTSSNSTTQFVANEPYVNLDYKFLNGFVFSLDYTHYNYQNKQQQLKNSYDIANMSLFYQKENSAWHFKIETQNLFNTSFKRSNSLSDDLISDIKTYILPRVFMFSIGYHL